LKELQVFLQKKLIRSVNSRVYCPKASRLHGHLQNQVTFLDLSLKKITCQPGFFDLAIGEMLSVGDE
jgi:hypothetical protein